MPVMRIPYTDPLPAPRILPPSASTASGTIAALTNFLITPSQTSRPTPSPPHFPAATNNYARSTRASSRPRTLLLTGAGISVASGLADYRGSNGTYTLNKTYRPIYFSEFVASHASRQRYWARSFLGWENLRRARPNTSHRAVADLGQAGALQAVITQNVDSFHKILNDPISLPTLELHGYLRATVCLTCRQEYDRQAFQERLCELNPAWHDFLNECLRSGALDTENPIERRQRGLRTNPDGDVDLPGVDYASFNYPACPRCLGKDARVDVDQDGAVLSTNKAGVLKPAVVMFGESIPPEVKTRAEEFVDSADKMLVIGSSLATYSAWRLVKKAHDQKKPVGILNMGGVRGEEGFFEGISGDNDGTIAFRSQEASELILPEVVERIGKIWGVSTTKGTDDPLGEANASASL
ncbi:DHS-like NAD/FAD-binding domain-containing protein [Phyllosticta citribraziliensis]|uniref:DHS-like NAD/FAD-binding domain-containing protein n=1 Tax=Phyllosticta citribraziliensis TaxID=989973 RepID=A0ABR1LU44_9PEZI